MGVWKPLNADFGIWSYEVDLSIDESKMLCGEESLASSEVDSMSPCIV